MDEKTIEKIALLTTIIGLLFLYIIAQDIIPNVLPETKLDQTTITTISGTITKMTTVDKALFLEIEGQTTQTKKVIVFTSEPTGVKQGDHVEISGTTQIRNGQEEILATEIKLK